jgi:hypothetical protein
MNFSSVPDCVGTLASDRLCPKCESAEKATKTSLDKRSIADVAAQEPVQMVTRVESTKKVVSSTKEPVSSTMELVSSSNREPVSMTEGSTHEIREPSFYKALFLPGGLPDDTEVGYYVKGQCFLTGVKKGVGIYCNCCQQTISCRLFEQHAGWAARCNPYRSIYLAADGRSLHLAAQSLMGQQKLKKLGIAPRPDESMVYCNECGDGGELLLCTSCPRSYHEGMLLVLTLSVIIVFLLEQALCRLCAQPRSLMCLMGYLLGRLCGVEECSSFCW